MKLNGYQIVSETDPFILHETKWKEKVRAGEISPAGVDQIKQMDIAPSPQRYLKGIARGTKNINKKHGTAITHYDNLAGPSTSLSPGTVNLPSRHSPTLIDPKLMDFHKPMTRAIVNRHEADEAAIGSKMMKKVKPGRTVVNLPGSMVTKMGMAVGQHVSPEVIDRERKSVNFANSMYGLADDLKNTRNLTGEYPAVSAMTPKQIKAHNIPASISTKNIGKLAQRIKKPFKEHPFQSILKVLSVPKQTISTIKKAVDYVPGSGQIKTSGSSIPMTLGSLKQGGKLLAKRFLKK